MQSEQPTEPQRSERPEDEERDRLIDPGDAVKAARRKQADSPEDESVTELDKVRESGFGA